jgi:predicted metal-binding membrane protein
MGSSTVRPALTPDAGKCADAVVDRLRDQFPSLKYCCLDKCRAPLSFVVRRWNGR